MKRKPREPRFFVLQPGAIANEAIAKLASAFPVKYADGSGMSRQDQQGNTAARLFILALANIDVIAPRIRAMISYCNAEGLDQTDYLERLIQAKFKKKLHLGRRTKNVS